MISFTSRSLNILGKGSTAREEGLGTRLDMCMQKTAYVHAEDGVCVQKVVLRSHRFQLFGN